MYKSIIDIHLHSNHSDGKLSPHEIITKLKNANIKFTSLTDHDTTGGSKEFKKLAEIAGIKSVDGVEISTSQNNIGLHILGYGININSRDLKNLFVKQQEQRKKAFVSYVNLFKKAGFKINQKKFNNFKKLKTIAKPHVFRLIFESSINRKILEEKFGFAKIKESRKIQGMFIDKFMSYPGQLAYVKKRSITHERAIKLIRKSGGLAVLAHPGVENEVKPDQLIKLIKKLISYGLAGIEAYSFAHSQSEMAYFHKLSKKLNLITTIGTDDHDGTLIGKLGTQKHAQNELISHLFKN